MLEFITRTRELLPVLVAEIRMLRGEMDEQTGNATNTNDYGSLEVAPAN